MRQLSVLLLLLCTRLALAQTPPPTTLPPAPQPAQPSTQAPQLSPQAAYDEAMRPLDITRRSVKNWSDAELAALAAGMKQASDSCTARTPDQFTGEDLLAYARLCTLGQQWDLVRQAATNYLIARSAATPAEKLTGFPNLATAFEYEILASLRLDDPVNAFGTAQTMLRTVPYNDLVSDATNATIHYVQMIHTDQALNLLNQRQPILLSLLRAHTAPSSALASSVHPPLPLYTLYADAIALPAMQQFANRPRDAADSFAELESALPASLSADDAILTAQSRHQYQLLGSPLPDIATFADLLNPSSVPTRALDKKPGSATVLFLFPDWCAQCVGMGKQFTTTAIRLNQLDARFYALLAQANQPPPTLKAAPKSASRTAAPHSTKPAAAGAATQPADPQTAPKPTAAELLAGTPTLVVPNQTLTSFVATDFPLIVVADHSGIVRSIQVAPENALVADSLIDQIVDRVIEQWPPPQSK